MQKILFLVTQSELGGAQKYIYDLVSHLDPEKYEFLVAAGVGDGELFKKCQMLNVKCQTFRLRYLKRVPWPWEILLSIFEIFNLLKREKPNILFICSTTAGLLGSIASFLVKLTTKNYQLKTIYCVGGWAFRDPRPAFLNWILLLAEKITAPFKDKIIILSEIDRELAIKYRICPAEKIIKIYHGIDVDSLNFLAKEEASQYLISNLKSQISKIQLKTQIFKIIGTVANFYKTKGLEYLIEAARLTISKLEHRTSNLVFIIIGEGKERPKLKALIKKYGLENQVFLVGRIPDAYQYLKAFDVFVLPSLKEGFPLVILEAMAAGIPIIATKVGALPEIIKDGKEGILIEPKKSQELAEKILWLLNHPEEAKNMGFRAKEKVIKEFPLEKTVRETEKLF